MKTYFDRIFWGLLVVMLDISVDNFDVLVDGLGYMLISAGCYV